MADVIHEIQELVGEMRILVPEVKRILDISQRQVDVQAKFVELLRIIKRQTSPYFPVMGVLFVNKVDTNNEGEKMQQVRDTERVPYAITEYDAKGNASVDPGDSASLAVDVADVQVVPDAAVDPAKCPQGVDPSKVLQTGFCVAGKTVGIVTATATFVHTDGTAAPPALQGQFEVVSGVPVTGGLTFGAPVPQENVPNAPNTPAQP